MKYKRTLGSIFLITIIILIVVSISMIASVSFTKGLKEYHNYYYFLQRQIIWIIIGLGVFYVVSRIDYRWYKKKRTILYILGTVMLLLVLMIGKEVNGAQRWLDFRFISIQPSEFVKLIFILYLASSLEFYRYKNYTPRETLIASFVPLMFYCVLIVFEKAFSNTLHLFIIGSVMIFMSRIDLVEYSLALLISALLGIITTISSPYRMKRIMSYMNGFGEGNNDIGYQARQSLIAIGGGGIFGRFYGNGLQKYFFLPEIHTDYIFSGFSEEFGFIGALLLMIVYMVILGIIIIAISNIKDQFGKFVLIGIFAMLSTQVLGNIAVVTGLMPSTGIPLPIVSYGGSSIIMIMMALGIVYNIIKNIDVE